MKFQINIFKVIAAAGAIIWHHRGYINYYEMWLVLFLCCSFSFSTEVTTKGNTKYTWKK